jgi:DNA-binding IclR family transcriptional regulator
VLGAFETRHPFLTLGEVAERSGLPPSTAHRLLAELEREGMVERWPEDRTYRLGVRLYELASRTPGALGLRETARPFLAQVHAAVRQHTQLGVRAGNDVLYIERFSARDSAVNHTVIGGRMPLYVSCLGLSMLAHADPEDVDAVIAAGLRPLTDRTITDPDALRRELVRVRADGFSETAGHIHPDSRGIGVPVLGPRGRVYAAIGVVVPNDGSSPRPQIQVLLEAAAGITRALEALE